jgi:hypothetical protein
MTTLENSDDMPLSEFSCVTTVRNITTPDGILPVATGGMILTVYPATQTYMVDFYAPTHGVKTVAWNDVIMDEVADMPLPELLSYEDRLRTRERFIAIVRRKLGSGVSPEMTWRRCCKRSLPDCDLCRRCERIGEPSLAFLCR